MGSFSDHFVAEALPEAVAHWRPMLRRWAHLNEMYSHSRGGGDSAYGHGELGNISLLAAAAWQTGFAALVEKRHEKQKGSEPGRSGGRADLILSPLNPGNRSRDLVEAKFCYGQLRPSDLVEKSRGALQSAEYEARRCLPSKPAEPCHAVALAFVVADLKTNEREKEDGVETAEMKREVERLIVDNITSLKEACGEALWAWCFPIPEREKRTPEKNYTPGVFLLGRVVESGGNA